MLSGGRGFVSELWLEEKSLQAGRLAQGSLQERTGSGWGQELGEDRGGRRTDLTDVPGAEGPQ